MGTNFYLVETEEHIGKRSAAGYYCFDCNQTLCIGGKNKIHAGTEDHWYSCCPNCGKPISKETLDESTAGRELGFNTQTPRIKTGVATCSSFSWDIDPIKIFGCKGYLEYPDQPFIKDEYGRTYTFQQFIEIMMECPIQLYEHIGKDFC